VPFLTIEPRTQLLTYLWCGAYRASSELRALVSGKKKKKKGKQQEQTRLISGGLIKAS